MSQRGNMKWKEYLKEWVKYNPDVPKDQIHKEASEAFDRYNKINDFNTNYSRVGFTEPLIDSMNPYYRLVDDARSRSRSMNPIRSYLGSRDTDYFEDRRDRRDRELMDRRSQIMKESRELAKKRELESDPEKFSVIDLQYLINARKLGGKELDIYREDTGKDLRKFATNNNLLFIQSELLPYICNTIREMNLNAGEIKWQYETSLSKLIFTRQGSGMLDIPEQNSPKRKLIIILMQYVKEVYNDVIVRVFKNSPEIQSFTCVIRPVKTYRDAITRAHGWHYDTEGDMSVASPYLNLFYIHRDSNFDSVSASDIAILEDEHGEILDIKEKIPLEDFPIPRDGDTSFSLDRMLLLLEKFNALGMGYVLKLYLSETGIEQLEYIRDNYSDSEDYSLERVELLENKHPSCDVSVLVRNSYYYHRAPPLGHSQGSSTLLAYLRVTFSSSRTATKRYGLGIPLKKDTVEYLERELGVTDQYGGRGDRGRGDRGGRGSVSSRSRGTRR